MILLPQRLLEKGAGDGLSQEIPTPGGPPQGGGRGAPLQLWGGWICTLNMTDNEKPTTFKALYTTPIFKELYSSLYIYIFFSFKCETLWIWKSFWGIMKLICITLLWDATPALTLLTDLWFYTERPELSLDARDHILDHNQDSKWADAEVILRTEPRHQSWQLYQKHRQRTGRWNSQFSHQVSVFVTTPRVQKEEYNQQQSEQEEKQQQTTMKWSSIFISGVMP